MTECLFCVSCSQKVDNSNNSVVVRWRKCCMGLSRPKHILPEDRVNIWSCVALECAHAVPQRVRAKDTVRCNIQSMFST